MVLAKVDELLFRNDLTLSEGRVGRQVSAWAHIREENRDETQRAEGCAKSVYQVTDGAILHETQYADW
jgi:hypothetical protein